MAPALQAPSVPAVPAAAAPALVPAGPAGPDPPAGAAPSSVPPAALLLLLLLVVVVGLRGVRMPEAWRPRVCDFLRWRSCTSSCCTREARLSSAAEEGWADRGPEAAASVPPAADVPSALLPGAAWLAGVAALPGPVDNPPAAAPGLASPAALGRWLAVLVGAPAAVAALASGALPGLLLPPPPPPPPPLLLLPLPLLCLPPAPSPAVSIPRVVQMLWTSSSSSPTLPPISPVPCADRTPAASIRACNATAAVHPAAPAQSTPGQPTAVAHLERPGQLLALLLELLAQRVLQRQGQLVTAATLLRWQAGSFSLCKRLARPDTRRKWPASGQKGPPGRT